MLQPGTLATKVLCLTQVVSADELRDDEDYADILEDMRLECGKFGMCLNLKLNCFFLLHHFFWEGGLVLFLGIDTFCVIPLFCSPFLVLHSAYLKR